MEAGTRRLWLKAQNIAIGNVVADRLEIPGKALGIAVLQVLTPGEPCNRLWSVTAQAIDRHRNRRLDQLNLRHEAQRRAGWCGGKMRPGFLRTRLSRREGNAINSSIGIADRPQGVIKLEL